MAKRMTIDYVGAAWEDIRQHVEETLLMESLDFGVEHVTEDCQCEGKWCYKCQSTKCFGAFNRNKHGKFGLAHECRLCVKAHFQLYKDRQAEHTKAWRKANPEKQKAMAKKSKRAHADAYNEKTRLWHLANLEREKEYRRTHSKELQESGKRWIENNREHVRIRSNALKMKRLTRKTQAGGSYTVQEWLNLKDKYNNTCLCCGKQEPEIKLTADHVIPVSKLGTSNIDNIQPLCNSCNARKKDKIIDYR